MYHNNWPFDNGYRKRGLRTAKEKVHLSRRFYIILGEVYKLSQ